MIRALTTISLAALLLAPAAQARPTRAQAQPSPSPAVKARQTALKDFDARMSRLDSLMGLSPRAAPRSRSAEAGRSYAHRRKG